MTNWVLVEDVARVCGCEPRQVTNRYPPGRKDWGRRDQITEAEAEQFVQENTAYQERETRLRQAFANEPDRRRQARQAVWQAAAASVRPDPNISEPQRYALQVQAARAAVAEWDARNPEPQDLYAWAAERGL
jgi:hypothetical protein